MKTVAKILLLAAVVALFAFIGITYGVPVEKNDSIVYFGTNVFLLDNTNTPLHVRMQGFAAQDYWTNGIAVSATNTAEEIVELFIHHEEWQAKIGLYDPTNGLYRLWPHNGIIKGSYTTNPPLSLWDGETGAWKGGVEKTNGWEIGSHTGLVPNVGGGSLNNGNWLINNGTLGIWSNADSEVRIGVVQSGEIGTDDDCGYIGFENGFGYGLLSFREEGDSGKFVFSEGAPDAYGPWAQTSIVVKTIRANIEADIATVSGQIYFGSTNRMLYSAGTNLYFYASGVVGRVSLIFGE